MGKRRNIIAKCCRGSGVTQELRSPIQRTHHFPPSCCGSGEAAGMWKEGRSWGPAHLTVQNQRGYEALKPLVQSPSALPQAVTAEEVVLSWKVICWDNWESGGCCCSTSTLHRPGCGASPVVVKLIWEVPTWIFIYNGSKGGCAAKGALESSRPKPKLRRVSFKPRSSHWCLYASSITEDNVCGTSLVGRYQINLFFFHFHWKV